MSLSNGFITNPYLQLVNTNGVRYVLGDISNINVNDCSNVLFSKYQKSALSCGINISDSAYSEQILGDQSIKNQFSSLTVETAHSSLADSPTNQISKSVQSLEDKDSGQRPRRKPRTVFSRAQLNRMKEAFSSKPYLTTEERKTLATEIKVTAEQVKVWFQNHRSKLKRQGKLISTTTCVETIPSVGIQHQNNNHFNPMQAYSINQPHMNSSMPPGTYLRTMYPPDQTGYEYCTPHLYQLNEQYNNLPPPSFYPNQNTQASNIDINNNSLNGNSYSSNNKSISGYINNLLINPSNANNISNPNIGNKNLPHYALEQNYYKNYQGT
ncbi:hypothetical protein HZS_7336 [Henneguya salminicola]|uniref:Homeobox protein Nkx-23 (Trinotate prediction) n=1 Tax=Henneguya salminicola TaxID=69463 RepID=A0A6G3MGB1_HENSL|nr:hypothetical protein HZS_7336 [Henneguya salminicola]